MRLPTFVFFIYNIICGATILSAHYLGILAFVWAADLYYIVVFICLVFILGLLYSFHRILFIDYEYRAIDHRKLKSFYIKSIVGNFILLSKEQSSLAMLTGTYANILHTGNIFIRRIRNVLPTIGLGGTVFGVIIALSGLNPEIFKDIELIGPAAILMISGMEIAFYTTLVGIVLSVWLTFNYHIIEIQTEMLANDMILYWGELEDS